MIKGPSDRFNANCDLFYVYENCYYNAFERIRKFSDLSQMRNKRREEQTEYLTRVEFFGGRHTVLCVA